MAEIGLAGAPIASRNAARRWGAGTAAIARTLIAADQPLTGVAIADAVGVSQPRASQVLKHFFGHDAVRATADGYVGRPSTLLDLYGQRSRPLLIETESYWYSTRPRVRNRRSASLRGHTRSTSTFPSPPTSPPTSSCPGGTRCSPSTTRTPRSTSAAPASSRLPHGRVSSTDCRSPIRFNSGAISSTSAARLAKKRPIVSAQPSSVGPSLDGHTARRAPSLADNR